jgi:hypothetical protein
LLQLVELLAKINILSEFFFDASILRLELLEATLDCFQLLIFFFRAFRMRSGDAEKRRRALASLGLVKGGEGGAQI